MQRYWQSHSLELPCVQALLVDFLKFLPFRRQFDVIFSNLKLLRQIRLRGDQLGDAHHCDRNFPFTIAFKTSHIGINWSVFGADDTA